MAAADTYELTIDQARDWEWTVWWKVGKTQRTATVKPDIGSYQFFFGLKEEYSDPTCLVLLTIEDGIEIGPDGSIQLWMVNTKCATLPAKRLKWELVAISTDNKQTALGKGTAVIVPKVV